MIPPAPEDNRSPFLSDPNILGSTTSEPADGSGLLEVDAVQRALNRSRASIYRYANTDPTDINPPFNPKRLNPEYRQDPREALLFHPNEVARFAQDVLKIKQVKVEVFSSPATATQTLLEGILAELQAIRGLLESGQAQIPSQIPSQIPTQIPSPSCPEQQTQASADLNHKSE